MLPFDGTAIEGIADLAFLEEQAPNLRLVFDITGFPSISLANERDRRDPRRSRTPGEQISLQHGCFLSVRIVHQTRASNSAQITAGGTGGSNPPLSANQSVHFPYILEKIETPRGMRRSFCLQRTGESRFMPDSPVSAGILSVRSKTGSLQRLNTLWWGFVQPSPLQETGGLNSNRSGLCVRERRSCKSAPYLIPRAFSCAGPPRRSLQELLRQSVRLVISLGPEDPRDGTSKQSSGRRTLRLLLGIDTKVQFIAPAFTPER